jgi:uncharacterized membrane-anchored protein
MALKIKANPRTLVRGYFLETIEKLNYEINDAVSDPQYYKASAVEERLRAIKKCLSENLDTLTNDTTLE